MFQTNEFRLPLQQRILNIIGQVVYEEPVSHHTGTYQKTIDLSRHAKGAYLLQVVSGERMMSRKVVVQ